MQKAPTIRNSHFIERWSKAEIINARLGVMVMIQGIVILGLVLLIVFVNTKPRAIYVVPGASSDGVFKPQLDNKYLASIFASTWLLNWTNYTADSVDEVFKRAQRFMSPSLLNQTRKRISSDIETIKKDNRCSLFSMDEEPKVAVSANGYEIIIKGHKAVYMGREQVKIRKVGYHLKVIASAHTEFNPYGLMVDDISIEDLI